MPVPNIQPPSIVFMAYTSVRITVTECSKKSDLFKQKDPLEAPSFCFEMLLVFFQGRGSGQFAKGLLSSKSSEDFR